ncbi:TetR/AcrR family transcriptional regulator [Aeromicrobium sp. UC242_57]
MVERAQLSQERSRARREALLDAAIDLFAEGGSRAITHRAVAARAGLPSATTTYYFESIDELIRAAPQRSHRVVDGRARGLHRRRPRDRRGPRRRRRVHRRTVRDPRARGRGA